MIAQWKMSFIAVTFLLGGAVNQVENQRIKPTSYKQRSFLLQ